MTTSFRALGVAALVVTAAACDETFPTEGVPPSVDAQLRQVLGQYGVVPIGPVAPQDPALVELGRGLISIYLYSLMRSCCGPGPKTAVFAGIVAWLAFSVTGPAQFIPLGFYSHALWLKVGAFQLVTSIVAAIAGAALYKERKG